MRIRLREERDKGIRLGAGSGSVAGIASLREGVGRFPPQESQKIPSSVTREPPLRQLCARRARLRCWSPHPPEIGFDRKTAPQNELSDLALLPPRLPQDPTGRQETGQNPAPEPGAERGVHAHPIPGSRTSSNWHKKRSRYGNYTDIQDARS